MAVPNIQLMALWHISYNLTRWPTITIPNRIASAVATSVLQMLLLNVHTFYTIGWSTNFGIVYVFCPKPKINREIHTHEYTLKFCHSRREYLNEYAAIWQINGGPKTILKTKGNRSIDRNTMLIYIIYLFVDRMNPSSRINVIPIGKKQYGIHSV